MQLNKPEDSLRHRSSPLSPVDARWFVLDFLRLIDYKKKLQLYLSIFRPQIYEYPKCARMFAAIPATSCTYGMCARRNFSKFPQTSWHARLLTRRGGEKKKMIRAQRSRSVTNMFACVCMSIGFISRDISITVFIFIFFFLLIDKPSNTSKRAFKPTWRALEWERVGVGGGEGLYIMGKGEGEIILATHYVCTKTIYMYIYN